MEHSGPRVNWLQSMFTQQMRSPLGVLGAVLDVQWDVGVESPGGYYNFGIWNA